MYLASTHGSSLLRYERPRQHCFFFAFQRFGHQPKRLCKQWKHLISIFWLLNKTLKNISFVLFYCLFVIGTIQQDEMSPLHYASKLGKESAAQILITAGADLNARTKVYREILIVLFYTLAWIINSLFHILQLHRTALHYAAMNGFDGIANRLLSQGAQTNLQDFVSTFIDLFLREAIQSNNRFGRPSFFLKRNS